MTVVADQIIGQGNDSANASTLSGTTSQTIAAGERVVVALAVGNNVKAAVTAGGSAATAGQVVGTLGGVNLTLCDPSKAANNSKGAVTLCISDPFPGGAASGISLSVNLTAANTHKPWIAATFAGISTATADVVTDGASGSTAGGLVTTETLTASSVTATSDELVVCATFIDQPSPGTVTTDTGYTSLAATQTESTIGILVFQSRIITAVEKPTNTISWATSGRATGVLASFRGTFVPPPAAATPPTGEVLWGIGLNFADDTFADTYAELQTNDPYGGPGVGGLNRPFVAGRANYASDSTTYPSGFGSMVNSFIVTAYAQGAATAYQNGHPKNPLAGGDNPSYAAWSNVTAYTVGNNVSYNGGGGSLNYVCLVNNTGQTPDQGAFGLGTTYWAPVGTYWASVAAGTYDAAFLTFFGQVAAAADGNGVKLWRPDLPFIYSFAHEQSNGGDTTPNGPGAGTPSQYAPAHQHVYNLLVSNGYHISVGGPIAMAFIPDNRQIGADPAWGPTQDFGPTSATITWPVETHGGTISLVSTPTGAPSIGTYATVDGRVIFYTGTSGTTLTGCTTISGTMSGTSSSGVHVVSQIASLSNAGYTFSALDPGAAYVDFYGCDIYSHNTSQTAALLWPPVQAIAAAKGKPWIVPECGCDAANGSDAGGFCVQFWQTVDGYVRSWGGGRGAGQLYMVCFTSRIASGGDYRMNASQAILNQFRVMAGEPWWGGTSAAAIAAEDTGDLTLDLVQGDSLPVLLQNVEGDLTSVASVQFVMTDLAGNVVVNSPATLDTPPGEGGIVSYIWTPADTATPGLYFAHFQVLLSGGGQLSAPQDQPMRINIAPVGAPL